MVNPVCEHCGKRKNRSHRAYDCLGCGAVFCQFQAISHRVGIGYILTKNSLQWHLVTHKKCNQTSTRLIGEEIREEEMQRVEDLRCCL